MQNLKLKIKNRAKGFTLIELLIVIAIIGVLATLLMVNFIGVRQRARDAQRKSDLRQVQSALEIYRSDNSSYPSSAVAGQPQKLDAIWTCQPGNGSKCTSATSCFGNGSPTCSTVYMQTLPVDPSGAAAYNGGSYYYWTDGSTYVLGACLENSGDSQATATNPYPDASPACSSGKYYVLNNP
jgi:general secretion pathway protein G